MVKVYKDIFSGKELASDSYPQERKYEDCAIFIKSQFVEQNDDCGIPDNDEDGAGGNDGPTRVNNISGSFHLTETSYKKAEYVTWAKGYMKRLLGKIEESKPERVAIFKAQAQLLIKFIVENFDNCSFYTPDLEDDECMIVAALWPENAAEHEGPTFIYFADGVREEKY